jgi:uncharacterized protein YyaL (SSP411 family)
MSNSFDARSGEWVKKRCTFDDIGDYLHYVVWYGKTVGKDYEKFAIEQIKSWQRLRNSFGFYLEYFPDKGIPRLMDLRSVSIYQNQDALVGLSTLYKMTKNQFFLNKAMELCRAIIKYAISPAGFVYNKFIPCLRIPLFKHSKSEIDGLIIEELCKIYQFKRDEIFLEAAKKIANAWMSKNEEGMFVDRIIPILNIPWSKRATMMKSNTNMLFGLMALYEILKDEVIKERIISTLTAMKEIQLGNGSFVKATRVGDDLILDSNIELTQNFAMIDVFLEAYLRFEDKEYLMVAKKCAEYWVKKQSNMGFFPEREVGQENWYHAKLDPNADFVTELLKLHELTKDKRFLKSAKKWISGVMKHWPTNIILVKSVNFKDGKIINPINETKNLGGLLRALLLMHHCLNGKDIYKDKKIWTLVRDR